jgi:hypothetical protein
MHPYLWFCDQLTRNKKKAKQKINRIKSEVSLIVFPLPTNLPALHTRRRTSYYARHALRSYAYSIQDESIQWNKNANPMRLCGGHDRSCCPCKFGRPRKYWGVFFKWQFFYFQSAPICLLRLSTIRASTTESRSEIADCVQPLRKTFFVID